MSKRTWEFTTDDSDRRLLIVDIIGSIAHVNMLSKTGIIEDEQAKTVLTALEQILAEGEAGAFEFLDSDEDVHSAVERRLGEIVGDVAGKLHTGRSRNDQIALDLRLYLSRAGHAQVEGLHDLAATLTNLAEGHVDTLIPSYTHLQQAQPTTLGHHLLAYAWMALRSVERFTDALKRIEVSPLGAGAASGSSLPLDREMTSRSLGLSAPMPNSLDAVGTRDFVAEYVFCCAQAMTELSRLSEEIVLWATKEFGWVRLGDEVSTGSSALPQKRNPDIAELIRGRAASVAGDVAGILSLQKGLPLAYNRDLQEDKQIVFHADDILAGAIPAMIELLNGIVFDPPPPGAETTSIDLAEALVMRGVPFREAHGIVGRLIAHIEAGDRSLVDLTFEDLATIDSRFENTDLELVDPAVSVARRVTSGSGSPQSVRDQIKQIRAELAAV
jgi:argininosuccinate lyase